MNSPGRQLSRGGPISWCVLAAALFGASSPASKPLLNGLSPLALSGILYLGAALAVSPWAIRNPRGVPSDRRNIGRLLGAVLFGGMLGPVFLLTGLARAPASSVALWLNLETVATALLARFFFKEHMARNTWVAIALVVLGSLLLSPGTPGGGSAVVFVALACLAWGLDNNLTAVIDGFSPAQITFAKGAVAGSVNLGLALVLWPTPLAGWAVAGGLAVGALSYGASLLLYIAGAQQLGATRSQLIFSTAPAFGLVLAWLVLGEEVLIVQLVAALLMALAMWLWYRERHEHRHAHATLTHRHWHRHDDGHHAHAHGSPVAAGAWHSHEHTHEPIEHSHPHRPDLHHRHDHRD